jgi:integrase
LVPSFKGKPIAYRPDTVFASCSARPSLLHLFSVLVTSSIRTETSIGPFTSPLLISLKMIQTTSEPSKAHLFIGELSRRKTRSGQPVGPRRINMISARFRTIFATAKRRRLVTEDPMLFVQNLREPKAEVDPFELEEAERLVNTATGQDRAIITVLIFCGLRPNEALALRWQDVDFDRRILKIRRTIHRFGGIGLPKTASSERDVDMLDPVIVELEEQRARTQMRGELVFLNDVGGPVDLTNFRDRNWKRILIRARLRARAIYQCRHTFAALQLSRGENPQYVAHQMGHTNLEMIIRHYARLSRKPERVGTLAHFPPSSRKFCQKNARKWLPRTLPASAAEAADRHKLLILQ